MKLILQTDDDWDKIEDVEYGEYRPIRAFTESLWGGKIPINGSACGDVVFPVCRN